MTDTMTMNDDEPRAAGKKTIWTRAARELLFERLVARFGPYAEWEKGHAPGHGLDDEYEKFCDVFAETVGSKSGKAVRHQIMFAVGVTSEGTHHWTQAHARNAILNMAAAFEAGFIEHADFPELLAAKQT
jgi:hypothetical protein